VDPIQIARLAACAFFCILFLQSGVDKVLDWKGNLDWLTGHFAKSPLRGIGAALGLFGKGFEVAIGGLALSVASLIMLFAGQRIAKDYPGAATLATYFGVALVALFLMK
jgi:hypothetical protein